MLPDSGHGAVFHLAFSVTDLEETRRFYTQVIGCAEGSNGADWVILDFFGHKITATLDPSRAGESAVHDDPLPLRHFGVFIDQDRFHALSERLRRDGVRFVIEPQRRGAGTRLDQWIMFTTDPSGNGLEFQSVVYGETILWPDRCTQSQ